MDFHEHLADAEDRRHEAEQAALEEIGDAWDSFLNGQEERIDRAEASDYVWEVVDAVRGQLERQQIPTDTKLLKADAIGKYALITSKHRAPSKVASAFRHTREDLFRSRNLTEGWDLGIKISGYNNGEGYKEPEQFLFLGADGNLYGTHAIRERERRKGVIVPTTAFEPGVSFYRVDDEVNDCEQILKALAQLVDRHELNVPPGGWPTEA